MKLELLWGRTSLALELPDDRILGVLDPASGDDGLSEADLIENALANPVGSLPLRRLALPDQRVAVVTSDITRPCPSHLLLPPLLAELEAAGLKPEQITIVFALGVHRPHTEAEMRKLAGDAIFERYSCIDHDMERCVRLGVTAAGTPVDIFRPVAEANLRICLGNVEYHYFAGYSGGAKALMPGVSSRAAIQNNHRMMVLAEACAGGLEDNPLRRDLDEAGAIAGIDFILNVVLDAHKRVRGAFAGHMIQAHRAACAFLDGYNSVTIPAEADVVVASAGGFPKDINVYQAQKALDNAIKAVRPGGVVVWLGECAEGLGEHVFERWVNEADSPDDLIQRVEKEFELGGHKAVAIAMAVKKARVFFVTALPPDLAKKLYVEPFADAQTALDAALKLKGPDAGVLIMPHAASTLPRLAVHV